MFQNISGGEFQWGLLHTHTHLAVCPAYTDFKFETLGKGKPFTILGL